MNNPLGSNKQLKAFLNQHVEKYNKPNFIENDPISIPHKFSKKQDIEIAGFLAAILAWGQRKTIVKNATHLISLMHNTPHDFLQNANASDFKPFVNFVHRTFNGTDCLYFLNALSNLYKNTPSLENLFLTGANQAERISNFKKQFFAFEHLPRSRKHIADPLTGAAAKRINMFLRWMVRTDNTGVDFGIWKKLKPRDLMLPLDVHTANVSRKLNLLKRKQNDWRAVEELTQNLQKFDKNDPVKYDFALFGLGVSGFV